MRITISHKGVSAQFTVEPLSNEDARELIEELQELLENSHHVVNDRLPVPQVQL